MKTAYSLVGMNHQKSEEIVRSLAPGAPLTLVREPMNPYDKFAVAVWVGDRRVAYVPGKNNKKLADMIDRLGEPFAPPAGSPTMAMDSAPLLGNSFPAVFKRSPNSGYPQAEVEE